MRRLRVATILGTRPEGIKMAPVIRALAQVDSCDSLVVSTGQHTSLLQPVIDLFGLEVDHQLDVMRSGQNLASLTARLTTALDTCFSEIKPDMVLVQGDTTSVLTGALVAFYHRIPVGHVEAGLRTGDIYSPFPEEVNRRLVSPLASLHFAPTELSRQRLLAEGVDGGTIHVTGNTVIDALRLELDRQSTADVMVSIDDRIADHLGPDWRSRRFVLVTGHRRENFGQGFENICDALVQLAERFPERDFVYPVHLNPNVLEPVNQRLSNISNIRLIEPLAYDAFVALMSTCEMVLTDSGGVQEEAPSLGKPVLVMRENTERPEGVEAGTVRLVGANREAIVSGVAELLTDVDLYQRMSEAQNPYGDGHAAERVVRAVAEFFESAD